MTSIGNNKRISVQGIGRGVQRAGSTRKDQVSWVGDLEISTMLKNPPISKLQSCNSRMFAQ